MRIQKRQRFRVRFAYTCSALRIGWASRKFSATCIEKMLHTADMSEPHQRLREARLRAGYKTAADAARRLNVPYGTYSGHENGNRGIKRDEYLRYARIFGVDVGWLLQGTENRNPDEWKQLLGVPCAGSIGDLPNGLLNQDSQLRDHPFVIRMNYFPDDCFYVAVMGSYARNFVRRGWALLIEDAYYPINQRHEGELCFCKRGDDVFLYEIISVNSDGTCDIENCSGEFMKNHTN